jgi:hypothetical protein
MPRAIRLPLKSHLISIMSWIQDQFRQKSQKATEDQPSQQQFSAAARARWQKLGEELRLDVEEFNRRQPGAEFFQDDEDSMRVRNSSSGLELTLRADFENRNVRYGYTAFSDRSAGAPEGGMLSMRQGRTGLVEFYSADERLTSEETRQVLLEPMLFPRQSAA